MTLLSAAVLTLTPQEELFYGEPLGRYAQAWFLAQVRRHDPALADRLHNAPGARPYTLSDLIAAPWRPLKPNEKLAPGESYYLRVTTLNEETSRCWMEKALPELPPVIELGKQRFTLQAWTTDAKAHPWANWQTCGDIYLQAGLRRVDWARMEFAFPTAFRSKGYDTPEHDIPLPLPKQMQASWLRKWNSFAPASLHFPEIWVDFSHACLHISELNRMHTLRWKLGQERWALGFVGQARFSLAAPPNGAWPEVRRSGRHILHTLSDFAFYCGSGHHTTLGLGQTRRMA